jgi:hypothetical protein
MVLQDRRRVYSILTQAGVSVPKHVCVSRDGNGESAEDTVSSCNKTAMVTCKSNSVCTTRSHSDGLYAVDDCRLLTIDYKQHY